MTNKAACKFAIYLTPKFIGTIPENVQGTEFDGRSQCLIMVRAFFFLTIMLNKCVVQRISPLY